MRTLKGDWESGQYWDTDGKPDHQEFRTVNGLAKQSWVDDAPNMTWYDPKTYQIVDPAMAQAFNTANPAGYTGIDGDTIYTDAQRYSKSNSND